MGEPAQQLVAPVVVDDRLDDHRAEPRHALAEPGRHPAAVKRQIGAAGASRHGASLERMTNNNAARPYVQGGRSIAYPSTPSLSDDCHQGRAHRGDVPLFAVCQGEGLRLAEGERRAVALHHSCAKAEALALRGSQQAGLELHRQDGGLRRHEREGRRSRNAVQRRVTMPAGRSNAAA